MRSGERQFYAPPPINGFVHSWSFLRPQLSLSVVADDADIDLPDDFGGFIDPFLSFVAANNQYYPVQLTTVSEILKFRQFENLSASVQTTHAAVNRKSFAGTTVGMRSELILFPTPTAAGTLKAAYYAAPNATTDAAPYPLGGEVHGETLLASCLAAAEIERDKKPGPMRLLFMERLAASIAHDKTTSPRNIGYNGDGSADSYSRVRGADPMYNGVLMTDY